MAREPGLTLSKTAARQVRETVRYAQGDSLAKRRAARRQTMMQGDAGVRVIEIITASGSSWPRTYTAKLYRRGTTYGTAETARNMAETDYTNTAIANSYRAMQVGDRVLAWWNNTDSRWEFREFRLLSTQAC